MSDPDLRIAGPIPPYIVPFGPSANCTLELCPAEYSVYGYRPSIDANATFLALYALSAIIHVYLGIRWKQWFFMAAMVAGAVNAVLGYAGRIWMWYNPFSFVAFIIQIVCVTGGPVYYCAAIYVTLASAVQHFAPELSRFKNPKTLYWIFIPTDLVCLILQAAGGALSTVSSGASKAGVDMALVGLSLQVVAIVTFCSLFADYMIRYFKSPQYRAEIQAGGAKLGPRLKLFFGFMGLAAVLIFVRCAYRLAELREGYTGELIRDEPLFIGLEGAMVVVAVYCLMVGHPGLVFKGNRQPTSSERVGGHEIELLPASYDGKDSR